MKHGKQFAIGAFSGKRCTSLNGKGNLILFGVCVFASVVTFWQLYGTSSIIYDALHLEESAVELSHIQKRAGKVSGDQKIHIPVFENSTTISHVESQDVMPINQPIVKINLAGKQKNFQIESIRQATHAIANEYQVALKQSTKLNPEIITVAFEPLYFFSGFCNELMAFSSFAMEVFDMNITQILLPSLNWKDLGDRQKKSYIPHDKVWDVVHWNELAESNRLPRLVSHHPTLVNFDPVTRRWIQRGNATHPLPYGKQVHLFVRYKRYTRRFQNDGNHRIRHPTDAAIWEGALKPHPDLLTIIQDTKRTIFPSKSEKYLCLHARVEPEMQFHNQCLDDKVISLNDIVNQIYEFFPKPPVSNVLIVLNRQNLEAENRSDNPLAGENLDLLDQLRTNGMWNGSVRVLEAGTGMLPKDSYYSRYCSHLCGSILNYHLATEAEIFVGTPVSTFSSSVIAARTAQNRTRNYLYSPTGIRSTGNFNFRC